MKFIRAFLIVAVLSFSSSNANAAIAGVWNDVGYLIPSNHGEFEYPYSDETYPSEALVGTLAPNSLLTITYSLSNALGTSLNGYADYYSDYGSGYANSSVYLDSEGNGKSGSGSSDPLLTVIASLADPNNGSIVISNLTAEIVNFQAYLSSHLLGGESFIKTVYDVTSIPLPAALPLFGLGLAGLAAVRINRRKENV